MKTQHLGNAAARRMWWALQQHYGQGGWLLFSSQGNGGYWYSDNDKPHMYLSDIPVSCLASENQLLTLERFREDTQRWLDQRVEDRERDAIDAAVGD